MKNSLLIYPFIFSSLMTFGCQNATQAADNKDETTMYMSLGLMSGTSMDGIDGALLLTNGKDKVSDLGHTSLAYEKETHQLLKALEYTILKHEGNMVEAANADFQQYYQDYLTNINHLSPEDALQEIAKAAEYLNGSPDSAITVGQVIDHSTQLHIKAVNQLLHQTGFEADAIDVIGYHGQTLFHRPARKITIQVGDGQKLADATDIAVVNDFRKRDVEHGGQGAPFAPLYHQTLALSSNLEFPIAVVNCGGIANITVIKGDKYSDLIGYDTGPGNGLVDRFVKQRTNLGQTMDLNGQYGMKGKIHHEVVKSLYERSLIKDGENYFHMIPPKSLDINDMKLIPELDNLSLEDGCATLEAFTAYSIVKSLKLIPEAPKPLTWILAGGGWYNPVILRELKAMVQSKLGDHVKVNLAQEMGWNNKAMEAQLFAYLAVRSLQGQPISVKETTNVDTPLPGGHAYLPSKGATEKTQKLIDKNPDVLTGYAEHVK